MPAGGYPIIQRGAWIYMVLLAMGGIVAYQLGGWQVSVSLWAALVLLAYLFRDPERDIPSVPLAVLSPADGHVVSVGQCHDPYLDRPAVCIGITTSLLGAYTTRSPVEGKVEAWQVGGTQQVAEGYYGLWLRTDEDDDVVVMLKPGSVLGAPRCYVHSGERIGQGKRCGFMRFGGRVDVYLPEGSRAAVVEGDDVHAGSAVLATLVHKSP